MIRRRPEPRRLQRRHHAQSDGDEADEKDDGYEDDDVSEGELSDTEVSLAEPEEKTAIPEPDDPDPDEPPDPLSVCPVQYRHTDTTTGHASSPNSAIQKYSITGTCRRTVTA
jgi:hypothetical protein